MKQFRFILPVAVILFMTACNNSPKPAAVAPAADTATAKPSLTPYKAMMVMHTVKDFAAWLPAFESSDSLRTAAGLSNAGVGQGLDNDKLVVVFTMASDLQKAKDFSTSDALKKAMSNSGVTSAPTISFLNVLRDDTSTIPQQERIMITHHVKDFATWLKGFDAEGIAARSAYGIVDRALAQNADDPNTVTLLFAITDMAKLKARLASPDMKKIMTDAGVDGPPTITFFKWVK